MSTVSTMRLRSALLGFAALGWTLTAGAAALARELPDFTTLVEKNSPAVR